MLFSHVVTVLVVLFFSAEAIIRVPLTRVEDDNALSALKALVDSSILNAKSSPLPSVDLTKKTYQYFGNIQIGTPRQQFKVAFGTAFNSILVPSRISPYSCSHNHLTFNETASKSFKRNGNAIGGNPPYRLLQPAWDTVEIGGMTVDNQSIGLILDGDCSNLAYDGILGLGFPVSASDPTIIYSLYNHSKIPDLVVGLRLNRDLRSKSGGEVVIGGIDEKAMIKNSISYIPAVQYSSLWEINVKRVTYGSRNVTWNMNAILDSSVSFIGFPSNYVKIIIAETGALTINDTLLVDKGIVNKLPALTFNIEGKDYTLSGPDYVDTVTDYKGFRYMLLRPIPDGWVLGNAFIGKYYTILDYKNRRVSFATLNNSASSLQHGWILALALLAWCFRD